jgi:hypothetical protein
MFVLSTLYATFWSTFSSTLASYTSSPLCLAGWALFGRTADAESLMVQGEAAFKAVDAMNDAHVDFLRSVLGPTFTSIASSQEESAMPSSIASFPLAELEDFLAQCWEPDSGLRAHVENTLRKWGSQGDLSFEQLTVRFPCKRQIHIWRSMPSCTTLLQAHAPSEC